jgi:hypothetical protein
MLRIRPERLCRTLENQTENEESTQIRHIKTDSEANFIDLCLKWN